MHNSHTERLARRRPQGMSTPTAMIASHSEGWY